MLDTFVCLTEQGKTVFCPLGHVVLISRISLNRTFVVNRLKKTNPFFCISVLKYILMLFLVEFSLLVSFFVFNNNVLLSLISTLLK